MPYDLPAHPRISSLRPLEALKPADVDALRLVLSGESVIDWRKLTFQERDDVNQFLKLCLFDPNDRDDEARMRAILRDAVTYLRETFRYRVAQVVAEPREIHDLFLFASGIPDKKHQKIACIVLKVMHVIHHIEGRDLFHRAPMSEERLGMLAEQRVLAVCREMMEDDFPILEATGSAKSRLSLITKLIVKKETLAAQVYDRTRFRIVTRSHDDLVPVLDHLTRRLFPFHLVVPGQTQNSLLDLERCFGRPVGAAARPKRPDTQAGRNEFSGEAYRVLNFVVDLPLRLDVELPDDVVAETRARHVFCLVEFQIVDGDTAIRNESGESSHDRYKHRQKLRVLRRLSRGLVVPRKPGKGS